MKDFPIRPGVEYTREDVAKFRESPELANVLLRGYVFTLTIGGNFMLVPWNQAAGGGYTGKGDGYFDPNAGGTSYGRHETLTFDKQDLSPIVKRTPQERVDSLLSKVGEDLRFLLSGEAGSQVSGEETKRVAQRALQTADDTFEEAESRRVARTSGSQYA